jgi:hypothetical protein
MLVGQQRELLLKKASKEQAIAVATLNSIEWGGKLTLERYLEREEVLGATDFGRGHPVWVLVPKEDPNTTDFLSSCETYPKPLVYKRPDGSVSTGTTHGIASVFTPPAHRGKGFCSTMLKLLRERFSKETSENGHKLVGSHLYSDIGPEFYDRRGWTLHPTLEVVLPISEALALPTITKHGSEIGYSWLTLKDLPQIFEKDSEKIISSLPPCSVFMPPRVEAVDWSLARSRIYSQAKGMAHLLEKNIVGVQLSHQDDQKSLPSYCTWFQCFKENILYILWMSSNSFAETQALLALASQFTFESGLEQVILWDPQDPEWEQQGKVTCRTDEMPSLILFDGNEAPVAQTPTWIYNVRGNWI